jgi:hypothetical protein
MLGTRRYRSGFPTSVMGSDFDLTLAFGGMHAETLIPSVGVTAPTLADANSSYIIARAIFKINHRRV